MPSARLPLRVPATAWSPAAATPPVVVVSRAGCHLCDEVLATVERVCAELGVAWQVLDVDADPARRAAYGDLVPLTLVRGIEVGRWRLAEAALRDALCDPSQTP